MHQVEPGEVDSFLADAKPDDMDGLPASVVKAPAADAEEGTVEAKADTFPISAAAEVSAATAKARKPTPEPAAAEVNKAETKAKSMENPAGKTAHKTGAPKQAPKVAPKSAPKPEPGLFAMAVSQPCIARPSAKAAGRNTSVPVPKLTSKPKQQVVPLAELVSLRPIVQVRAYLAVVLALMGGWGTMTYL